MAFIETLPGIFPEPDTTSLRTQNYVSGDKIRFYKGTAQCIGGCLRLDFAFPQTITGLARTIYTYNFDNKEYTIIGTSNRIYVYVDGNLTNILPVQEATISGSPTQAVPNSLSTYYGNLPNNPVTTEAGSRVVTISLTGNRFRQNDFVQIIGITGPIGGIPDTQINGTRQVISATANSFTIGVSDTAVSNASGGGNGGVFSSRFIFVTETGHSRTDGDRLVFSGATNTGGITAAVINRAQIIYVYDSDTFFFDSTAFATSQVTGAGGASTVYAKPIQSGTPSEFVFSEDDSNAGFGYGGGPYGINEYGIGAEFTGTFFIFPTIWSVGQFNRPVPLTGPYSIVLCAGNKSPIWEWNQNVLNTPSLLPNAPLRNNWVGTYNNAVVSLGTEAVGGGSFANYRMRISDPEDPTIWTPSGSNLAYSYEFRDSDRLLSMAFARNQMFVFTDKKVFRVQFVGLPDKYLIFDFVESDGIIGPQAFAEVEDSLFWWGNGDWYVTDATTVKPLPNNTVSEYVYSDFNEAQKQKCFAFHNPQFQEVWWFYPSAGSLEPNRYVIFNYKEVHWSVGTWARTAAEKPGTSSREPYLINSAVGVNATLYRHELGLNDDELPLNARVTTNWRFINESADTYIIDEFVPDSIQNNNFNVGITTKLHPKQSQAPRQYGPYTITPVTEWVKPRAHGRLVQYTFFTNGLNQFFKLGAFKEEIIPKGRR